MPHRKRHPWQNGQGRHVARRDRLRVRAGGVTKHGAGQFEQSSDGATVAQATGVTERGLSNAHESKKKGSMCLGAEP